jgi:moderate conductance mechanosensitive channel
MIALLQRLLVIFLLAFVALPAAAAEPGKAPAKTETKDLERLVNTLEDPAKRDAFVADLKTLISAQKGAKETAEKPVGSQLLEAVSDKVESAGKELADAAATLIDLPQLATTLRQAVSNPETRSLWLMVLLKLAAILAAGLAGEWLALLAMRRPRAAIETQTTDGFWVHLVFVILRTVLELVAVAAFAAAAYGMMTLTAPAHQGQVIAIALINASVIARAVTAVARMLLAPRVASMRLIPMTDETANYSFVWIRRLTNLCAYGFLLLNAALALGLAQSAYQLLLKLLGLLVGLLLVMLVLQNRQHVAAQIRGDGSGALRQVRGRLADIWHILLIIYLVVTYGVWVLDLPGGFEFVLRATVLTVVIIAVVRGLIEVIQRGVTRAFALKDEQKRRFPGLEARTNRYLPMVMTALKAILSIIAAIALLEVWGLDIFDWLSGPVGRAILERVVTIALIIAVALLVWEVISAAIEQYLAGKDRDGNAVTRSQRAQTLLPLVRNVVFVVLAVMVVLTVLSELGINIGPLIAGAGIVGLAVGFGAQTMVKDFITGFFILIEDTVAVGDIVELGGHSGKVEAMSIRSIQLRDFSGQVHRIPFSEVTTTVNKSKDFSFATFDIGVGYSEDIDRCIEVIRDVGNEMVADKEYAAVIDGDMNIMGVQALGDSAVVIRARIRVKPGKQFGLQRAFNRLIKMRFDAEGIEIPFPHRTLYFGEDSSGNAPDARVRLVDERTEKPDTTTSITPAKRPEGEARSAGDSAGDAPSDG